ncbi:alcohol dehydrogenase GroES domain-containing protein [Leptolyngbya boryana NIES-2135]|jgi:threonine dehydrogenase-like Zn-dependent dehydrogenase|uniref:Alcohol dehydrogenase GroES domain-containing protein n=1 Tax=Leptolyngbya boryana NIES-2135 TaxID=1973484 RepID=A0A1Z4JHG8_LEPBY|nr:MULTISPECIES: zinc-dependent alcohol dehydrogenase [Leptolyngbya]BAY56204.1 alcohol dehydrogenase GroES domain-containing protein [Leptolyngbya boryana NIES-2135]MBD2366311.1 glutathione-dependent formaldehyde dehydrogenase [Leptolyngbya sp. FACHB-161]MBD2372491.1 glutathione-dependent formaldehyde dehydrogenase [Leptolyngbya sp. FACHB-238]MBD2396914.1 glutathione-dependent formaldehyde dehydrogenase [Leptolyngbya sp. FACHB-239]MBD2403437.1 glutathione-dependent formaldehyde dehydrogenase [
MKAVVFHGVGDIRLDNVPEPKIKDPLDAIVRLTASAICGTDLHMIRGTFTGMKPGTILGHEGVGIVEEVGANVRNLNKGDRVVIPSTIACGYCSYCRSGYYAQCDVANPNGPEAGTAFFGGPEPTGPIDGLQAEYARIPYASTGLVKLPQGVTDDEAILLSDIFPTAYFGAELAEITSGDTVAIFGCGPVGQFAIKSAQLLGAGRIFAIDTIPSRLQMAKALGAEIIDFNVEDPVETLKSLTGGAGVDRAIDAVGVDAVAPHSGAAAQKAQAQMQQFQQQVHEIAPQINPQNGNWHPGNAPSQALEWAVQALAKAGTLSIIGVYPLTHKFFPIGMAMNKNLTIKMGNCNHRKYIPQLIDMVQSGMVTPTQILSQIEPMTSVLDAYKSFDQRKPGWVKVELVPGATA